MFEIRSVSEFLNEYKLLKTIGKSKISVIKEIQSKIDNKIYVVKIVEKKKNKYIYNEYNILKKIQDIDNVIKLYDVFEDEQYFLLILEKLKQPDISEHLTEKGPMKILNVKKIIYVIAKILIKLHERGIVHVDIKPDNIMCSYTGQIYLFDFGLSREINELSDCCSGTIYYVSPEIIRNIHSQENIKIGKEIDIWSLGITMYVMLFRQYPFFSVNESEIPKLILNCHIKDNDKFKTLDADAQDLLYKCLKKNPDERIYLHEIINHDWFNDDL